MDKQILVKVENLVMEVIPSDLVKRNAPLLLLFRYTSPATMSLSGLA